MTALYLSRILLPATVVGLVAGTALGAADEIQLKENTVIPAVSESQLAVRNAREGDEFSARIDGDRDLPRGTRVEGRIVEIRGKKGDKPAQMLLEFVRLVLPDGSRHEIHGLPVAWNERNFTRRADGRFQAKPDVPREKYVLGGLFGGLLVGSMAKKPFEGALIGVLAGILMAESDNARSGDVVIRRGEKIGVLIERDATLSWDSSKDLRNGENRERDADRRDEPKTAEFKILYNDQELRFDRSEQPFEAGRVVMVPLESAAKQLGLKVDIEPNRDLILIESERGLAKLNRGSREYRVNDEHLTLSRNLSEKDGVLYIPLEVLKPLAGGTISVNGTKLED